VPGNLNTYIDRIVGMSARSTAACGGTRIPWSRARQTTNCSRTIYYATPPISVYVIGPTRPW